jgi:hypothetical protein
MPDIAAIVSRRESRTGGKRTPPLRGFLTGMPRVGVPMTLIVPLTDGSVDRLVTSLIQRVLIDPNGTLFVETRRSVYRVTLDEPVSSLPPPSRVRASFDGFELTVTSGSGADETSDGAEETE